MVLETEVTATGSPSNSILWATAPELMGLVDLHARPSSERVGSERLRPESHSRVRRM